MTAGARRGKHTIHDTRLHEAPHHRRLHALHEKQRTPAVMAIVRDTKPDRDAAIHEVRRKEQQAPRAEPQRRAELSLRQVVGDGPSSRGMGAVVVVVVGRGLVLITGEHLERPLPAMPEPKPSIGCRSVV